MVARRSSVSVQVLEHGLPAGGCYCKKVDSNAVTRDIGELTAVVGVVFGQKVGVGHPSLDDSGYCAKSNGQRTARAQRSMLARPELGPAAR